MQPGDVETQGQAGVTVVVGTVEKALTRDLRKLPAGVRSSALAKSALVLAAQLDDPEVSATAKSMCSRSLIETWDRLAAAGPAKTKPDRLDDLRGRRERRRVA